MLTFLDHCSYDPDGHVVTFPAERGGQPITCKLSLEALHTQAGLQGSDTDAVLLAFNEARDAAEEIAIHRYESGQIEPDGSVFIGATDF